VVETWASWFALVLAWSVFGVVFLWVVLLAAVMLGMP